MNIDLVYGSDILTYENIKGYSYDSEYEMLWFTDANGNSHEFHGHWHRWTKK